MDKEFVLHFVVTLEKNSWYYDDNKELAGDPSSIDESMYSLGLYCNVIGFKKMFFCHILLITRCLLRESAGKNCSVAFIEERFTV